MAQSSTQEAKIEIHTKNDTNFLELAILFDKPEFLQMLPQFRKDYGIESVVKLNKYTETINALENKTGKINFSKYQKPKELIKFAKDNQSLLAEDIEEEMDLYQRLDTEVNLVCHQFKRPPYFTEAVKQAIVCGVVEGDYLSSTSVEVLEGGLLKDASCFQLPQVAILVSPTTTYERLKEAFRIAQRLYKEDPKLSYFKPRIDFINNIRKYRYCYWERLKGETYEAIADAWVKTKLPKEDMTTYLEVMRGVKIYKNLLQK